MNEPKKPKLSNAEFEELWRRDQVRKAEEHEDIRKSVAECEVPVSDALLARLRRLFPTDAKLVLREHPGFGFSERRDHYRASLSIARLALRDLDSALKEFETEATADNPEIMKYKNRNKLEATERRIQKELFSSANAAASLVDHSRRLQKRFNFPEYEEKRKNIFGEDGLHELIIGLRVLLHHLHILEANWSLSADYQTGEKGAIFEIDKAALTRAVDIHAQGFGTDKTAIIRRYVENAPDKIDLYRLFKEYSSRLDQFHSWLDNQIEQHPPEAFADYDRCVLAVDRNSIRMSWNALVGNWLQWEKVPDVHSHLPDFLTPEQCSVVYQFPRNSKEQADAIIGFLDDKGAVDEPLRERVYRLFARLSEQEQKMM